MDDKTPVDRAFAELRASAHEFDVLAERLYRNISAQDFDAVKAIVYMARKGQSE